MKAVGNILTASLLAHLLAQPVFATQMPSFSVCANPQGNIIASYPNGTHGIVGSTDTYVGSDSVYKLSESQVMQCFCSTSGTGIQTNWLKASDMDEETIATYKSQGWFYVPDGSLWGLSADPYIAQNSSYACSGGTGGNGFGGPGDGLSDGRSDGRASCPECTAPPAIGGGEVLGLAATGDSWKIYTIFSVATLFLLLGIKRLKQA